MITFEQACSADRFELLNYFNADGSRKRWRRNGKTKVWKTRPGHFRTPVKHGLYDYGYIDHTNADQFVVAD